MNAPLLLDEAPMGVSSAYPPPLQPQSQSQSQSQPQPMQMPTGSIAAANQLQSADSSPQESIFKKSSHPTVLLFHLLFRSLAIAFYMFGWIFTSSFVTSFVVIILLLSFDFWTVKNVTGRLLVGLRWWNEVREDGENVWIFESREGRAVNQTDASVFWFALYAAPAVWLLFVMGAMIRFSFSWTLCGIVALVLNMANVIGYQRCHNDSRARQNAAQPSSFMQGIVTTMVGNSIGSFFSAPSTSGLATAARV